MKDGTEDVRTDFGQVCRKPAQRTEFQPENERHFDQLEVNWFVLPWMSRMGPEFGLGRATERDKLTHVVLRLPDGRGLK